MKSRILTVDDSKTIRLIVAKAFKSFDCDIFEASNGVEGLAVAARERPEIIILDLTMPIMDGSEMLAKLKGNPDLKGIPVIMLTAEAGRENVLKIAKMGVRDYLIKPFKEEVLIDRVGRIIDLKPRGDSSLRAKRFDDPLTIVVVDDKPAIVEQIRVGLADTTWTVESRVQIAEAADYCNAVLPEAVLASLSLPDSAAFSLFQMLRASPKTKNMPIFGLSVKTAADEQARAQQCGFSSIITKPIDPEDLKMKITRTLGLDTSYRYFEHRDGVLLLKIPAQFSPNVANDVSLHLRSKVSEAVDSGLDKVILDFSAVKKADVNVIKLGLSTAQICSELSLKQRIVGSDAVSLECKNYEETKDWKFESSFEEALAALTGGAFASAAA
jgi:two-component system, cell cycle response regulator